MLKNERNKNFKLFHLIGNCDNYHFKLDQLRRSYFNIHFQ